MAEDFKNKIKRLELENFTCFGKVAMDFSPGINVIIGENGTGKTHLLKVLYMTTNKEIDDMPEWRSGVRIKNYYPESVDPVNLIKKNTRTKNALIQIEKRNGQKVYFQVGGRREENGSYEMGHHGLFIPSQEMLSWFKGFIAAYEKRESSIDPTFYFLAKALALYRLKGKGLEKAKELIDEIEKQLGIEVQLEGDMFYIYQKTGGGLQAALEATGINKIAQIIWLILNGSLTKDTILFWDEPEANLNPKYITFVTKFLVTLANAGCQVFVATHDYLLTHQLSLFAENRDIEPNVPPMRFFALSKGENGTEAEDADTVAEIQSNAILDEYAAYHELQMELTAKRFQTT